MEMQFHDIGLYERQEVDLWSAAVLDVFCQEGFGVVKKLQLLMNGSLGYYLED